jgi:cytochrome oxidase assembly protein ShyY1
LQTLDGVERQEPGDGKDDHRDRIGEPVLLARGVHPGQAVKAALDRSEDGAQKVSLACVHLGDEPAERYGAANDQNQRQRDLRPAYKRHRITFLI